jgi:starvation-inducible DNA-binding protein
MYGEIWQHDEQASIDPIVTDIDLRLDENKEVCDALTTLLVDLFKLYVKTKVFHWHAVGPGFRGRHLLLAEQANQVLATIDMIGMRVRALGGNPIRSIAEISRLHQISDSTSIHPTTREMLAALLRDTRLMAKQIRRTYALCRAYGDFASASLLEDWIDEAEGRYWFLFEMHRDDGGQVAYRGKRCQAEVTDD